MRSTNRFALAALASAVLLATLPARGDDKDLLKKTTVPSNLMIILANANSTAAPLNGNGSMWDGDGDSYSSKLGAAKRVLKSFVQQKRGSVNIGLSTFDHNPNRGSIDVYAKHWLYEPLSPDFCGTQGANVVCDTFAEPAGTMERWGPGGEGPCFTIAQQNGNFTPPPCSSVSTNFVVYPKGTVLPTFFGDLASGASKTVTITLSNTQRIIVSLDEGDYGDAYTDGSLSTYLRSSSGVSYAVSVRKQYQEYKNSAWSTVNTPKQNPGDVTVRYVPVQPRTVNGIVVGLPRDKDHFYTTDPDAGKAIGFLSLTSGVSGSGGSANGDSNVSANCSGWEFQSNSAPVPLIKIPREYTWGAACDKPPQDSYPCVARLLRPQGVLVRYNGAGNGWTNSTTTGYDHDNAGYYLPGGDVNADGCVPSLRGAVDQGLDISENQAVLNNGNSSQVPLNNLLTNAFSYFNDPSVDGFYAGARQDDPNKSCRKSAVLLVYDSFNGCQNDNCSFLQKVVLQFSAIKVPVFVIGLGSSANQVNLTDPGICIAHYSGAQKADGSDGYFPVGSDLDLTKALNEITAQLAQSSQEFASSAVSSVQAGADQMVFLASFNPNPNRSIWNGRVNGYLLGSDGSLPTLPYTVTNDPILGTYTVPAPSNDPTVLQWNAGMNLLATPGTGATTSGALLGPGVSLSQDQYQDTSTDVPSYIPRYHYPGRKIVWSLPQNYAVTFQSGPASLPIDTSAFPSVPETRYDLVVNTANTDKSWPTLKALLGPQTAPPTALSPALTDTDAGNSLRFIWGDRDAVMGAAAKTENLYQGQKLGDIFHSNPALVGGPANYAYYTTNKNSYVNYYLKFKHRRRVLYAGANDGLLHAFDVGAWNRFVQATPCNGSGPPAECYDLGTGAELFAYAPRATMQIFKPLKDAVGAQDKTDEWTVDGAPSSDDVYIDPVHGGSPNAAERTWQTVVIGSTREGSAFEGKGGASPFATRGSYFALNVTQPDEIVTTGGTSTIAPGTKASPRCLNASGDATCQADWPTVLWEFNDALPNDGDVAGAPGAGYSDMGEAWSQANVGMVRICTSGCGTSSAAYDDKWVAIFGGGFDRERKNRRGNWLYMVDIETGNVLMRANSSCGINTGSGCAPVYFASIPSSPAAVDYNGDGYLDVIYVGDLKGQMWRVDLTDLRYTSPLATGKLTNKISFSAGSAKPFLLFQAPQGVSGQFFPIYFRPSVVFLGGNVGTAPTLGLAFGTGDRDDITAALDGTSLNYAQRFYFVVDDRSNVTRTEASLMVIPTTTSPNTTTIPTNGWYMKLTPDGTTFGQRLITDILTVSGVLYFGTFSPTNTGNGAAACSNPTLCGSSGGTAYAYTISYANANALAPNPRSTPVSGGGTSFMTNPIFFTSSDNSGHVFYTTNTVENKRPPQPTTTIVKEWKER